MGLMLTAEKASGNTETRQGASLGIVFREEDRGDEWVLSYSTMQHRVYGGTQTNFTLEGDTRVNSIEFKGLWHF